MVPVLSAFYFGSVEHDHRLAAYSDVATESAER
jgi:hypothetical protein